MLMICKSSEDCESSVTTSCRASLKTWLWSLSWHYKKTKWPQLMVLIFLVHVCVLALVQFLQRS